MNTGFGFSEIVLIVTLIVVFFGSKELPALLRQIAKFTVKIRRYSDRVKRELDDVTRSLDPQPVPFSEQIAKKVNLRAQYLAARKNIALEEREQKSAEIRKHLYSFDKIKNATMIMCYVAMGAEVTTHETIRQLLAMGKRIVIPYCIEGTTDLAAAEISNIDTDIIRGAMNIPEPKKELRKTFFKSDLQVIICPGVAFDRQGGRLGRGKGYYDTFLREFRGRIPLIGIAYDCQIMDESLPFEYHDVPMDMIITESGIIFGAPAAEPLQSTSPLAG
jgi:5-formyltetrahydrofolate cyclo-ligase